MSSRALAFPALVVFALAPATLQAQASAPSASPQAEVTVASAAARQAPDTATAPAALADSIGTPQSRPVMIPVRGTLTKRDLALTGGLVAAAITLFPVDQEITRWLRAPERQESGAWKGAMDGAEWGVETGSIAAGAGLWVAGLATRQRGVAEMGIHSLAAVAVTQQITTVLKGTFGRTRPYYADSAAYGWDMGGGFGESARRSFPSGHTSHAFAFATALSQEIGHNWPRAGKVATPLLYTGATAAALARVYNDKHWASDVTVGAAVGILSSRATLALLHGRPGNVFDRVVLNSYIVPQRGGAAVAVTLATP